MSVRAYLYTGGVSHPFAEAAAAIVGLLRHVGFETETSADLESLAPRVAGDAGSLLVVHALRWTMTQHEKYAPEREAWAYSPSAQTRVALQQHLENGGGLLGLHTASICFDDWPQWGRMLGGCWEWNRSWHPPLGRVQLDFGGPSRLTHGLSPCTLQDEAYCNLRVEPASEVFGWVSADDGVTSTGRQAACWSARYGRGRSVYLSPGHDAASLQQAQFGRLIKRSALWAAGNSDEAVEAA